MGVGEGGDGGHRVGGVGLGLGAWILIGAAGLMILAAILAFSQRYAFLTPPRGGAMD